MRRRQKRPQERAAGRTAIQPAPEPAPGSGCPSNESKPVDRPMQYSAIVPLESTSNSAVPSAASNLQRWD